MPPLELVWCLLIAAAIFFVVATVLLRVACEIANYLGRWSPELARIHLPKYRSCFTLILAVVVVVSVLMNLSNSAIGSWLPNWIGERAWHILAEFTPWICFAAIVRSGLSESQPAPTRLVTLAALLHVVMLLSLLYGLPRFMAVLV